jgi:Alpha/beta hydrolase domain
LSGVGNSGDLAGFCAIFGRTIPFSPSQLAHVYKNHEQFVSKWVHATHNDAKAGYLLPADAVELDAAAASSQVGK